MQPMEQRRHTVELNLEVVISIFGVCSRFKTELNSSASFPAKSCNHQKTIAMYIKKEESELR